MSAASPIVGDGGDLDPREAALADRAIAGAPSDDLPPSLRLADHLDEAFDYAAAALDLSLTRDAADPPPEALRHRVVATLHRLSQAVAEAAESPTAPVPIGSARTADRSGGAGRWGWYAAVVAVAAAVAAWWPSTHRPLRRPADNPTLFRQALLRKPSTAVFEGACTDDPLGHGEGVGGDVVWTAGRGEGYLRVAGIAANDPREFQYQLWIVDSTRDSRFPVDGGVFDVPAGTSEVIVPIRAALPVGEAAVFAVSVEKPGGVVVSDRRFVLVAEASKG